MNFIDLQNETSDLLNFNSGQTDQDFTAAQIKDAVNRAYKREYRKAREEGSRHYFFAITDIIWPASDVTLPLPNNLRGSQIVNIKDVTDDATGFYVIIYDGGDPPIGTPAWAGQSLSGGIHWKDRNTLQWGNQGPSTEKTLRVEHYPRSVDMVQDDDEPDLIPHDHREVIFWSAAVDLRRRADEASPQSWSRELAELRMDLHKEVSRGRPNSSPTTISSNDKYYF